MKSRQSRGNILYVDDEEGNLFAFVATFRKYYDNIYTVTSTKEGFEILRKHPIDVVLTDERMPEMTGIQFLETVITEFPDTIRMIVTGFSDIDAVINAINTGRVFRYIKKPWDKNELKFSIDQAIKTRALELSNRELVNVLQKEVTNKERILKIFQKYVPPNVVSETMPDADAHCTSNLVETRVVTALSCDIKTFIKPDDKKDSMETIQCLNDYVNIMAECIGKHKGFVNNVCGNNMLVVFGAPTSYIDNTSNAIYCALDMISLLDKIQAKSGCKFEIGIGINTGEVITGKIGSPQYHEYTVIGDTVDIAAQLQESLPKTNSVLITQSTFDEVKELFQCEELGTHKIRDKEIKLYKVIKQIASGKH